RREVAVAGGAIGTMQGQQFRKFLAGDEAPQLGFAHLHDVLEYHVPTDERHDAVGLTAREAEALHDRSGQRRSHLIVAGDPDTVLGPLERGWFPYVVQERGHRQRDRWGP